MTQAAEILLDVPDRPKELDPVTEYVRMRLVELTKEQDAKYLALSAGLPPSAISQIRARLYNIGPKTIARWAKLLKVTVPELTEAAYAWWETDGKKVAQLVDGEESVAEDSDVAPALRRALDLLRLARNPSPGEIRALLGHFGAESLAGLTDLEILNRFATRLEIDRQREVKDRADDRQEKTDARLAAKSIRRDWRADKAEKGHGHHEQGYEAGVAHEEKKKPKRRPKKRDAS